LKTSSNWNCKRRIRDFASASSLRRRSTSSCSRPIISSESEVLGTCSPRPVHRNLPSVVVADTHWQPCSGRHAFRAANMLAVRSSARTSNSAVAPDANRCFTVLQEPRFRRAVRAGEPQAVL
jgi:hypothetical protein